MIKIIGSLNDKQRDIVETIKEDVQKLKWSSIKFIKDIPYSIK